MGRSVLKLHEVVAPGSARAISLASALPSVGFCPLMLRKSVGRRWSSALGDPCRRKNAGVR